MNKAKLKVLLAALKEIVEELESEIYSDTSSYIPPIDTYQVSDYDEVYDDGPVLTNKLSYTTTNDDDGDGL